MSNDEIETSERAISFEQTQPKQRKTSLQKRQTISSFLIHPLAKQNHNFTKPIQSNI
jgi:hypothetical protein